MSVSIDDFVSERNLEVDHFSLKGLVKDVGKMATAPIKIAVNSVKGKKTDINYDTGFGKIVGGAVDKGNTILNKTVKSAGDVITGGLATKAVNVIRSDENKEQAFKYNDETSDTGIKVIDKLGDIGGKVGTVVGGVAGGASAMGGLSKLGGKNAASLVNQGAGISEDVLYEKGVVPGDQNKKPTDQVLDEVINSKPDQKVLDDMIDGKEYPVVGGSDIELEHLRQNKNIPEDSGTDSEDEKPKLASMFGDMNPIILIVIAVVILLIMMKK